MPQGSVLGPLLWNIAHDRVLTRIVLPEGVSLTCYADDTLLLAIGRGWAEVRECAKTGFHATVEAIRDTGLRVSLPKTEAYGFHRPRNPRPRDLSIIVDNVRIEVGSSLRYLGLVLDSGLHFGEHLAPLGPKIRAISATLGRLMPNLREPQVKVRRLYATVVYSVVLYGAPIWAESVSAARPLREKAIQL